jgi:CBS domain-containing protein
MATCSDIMTKNPTWCLSTDPVSSAAQLMRREELGLLPVVEDQQHKKVIGVVSDRDLVVHVIAEGRPPEVTPVADAMTRAPVTCHAEDDVDQAISAMAAHQIRRVLIVDDQGALVGIIAQADVALLVDDPGTTSELVKRISKPTPVHPSMALTE